MSSRTRSLHLFLSLLRPAPLALFALAFAVRCLTWPRVLGTTTGNLHLFGPDSSYHMRRVLYTLANFPDALVRDPYINFPHGGEPIWSSAFDFAVAVACLPFHVPGDALSAERIAIWIPPLLGAATVVALYRLASRHFGAQVGLAAGTILAVLSGHVWYSQIGFIDHHAAVALVATLLFGTTLDSLRATRDGSSVAWGRATALGVMMALLIIVWPGGLLHVAITQVLLAASWGTRVGPLAIRRANHSAIANGVALLCVLPWTLGSEWSSWSSFSPAVLSNFQPWLFGALSLHAAACGALLSRSGTQRPSWQVGAGMGVLVLFISLVSMPELVAGALDIVQWLLKEETFQAMVSESRPLFVERDGLGVRIAEARLSRFIYLLPIALVALAWLSRKRADGETLRAVVFFALVLAAVTLLQKRFFNSSSVAVALVMGWTLVEAARWIRGALEQGALPRPRRLPARAVAGLIATATALALLWPSLLTFRIPLQNVVDHANGRPISMPPSLIRQRAFKQAAVWLRENSPPTSGFLESDGRPEYGVMARWPFGHLIEYVARRPSVADNFGDDLGGGNFLATYRFFASEADEAMALLRTLRVRYVFLRTVLGAELADFEPKSMNHRLTTVGSGDTPGVAGLRLIYDKPMPIRGDDSRIRIFEVVPDV